MTTCVMGCQYAPCAEYFAHWLYHGHITLEAQEHYQKRTWRNRTAIVASRSDPILLTIPLASGKHQQMPIKSVLIAYDEPWVDLHINSLQSQYGKSAFADEVLPSISGILRSGHPTLWSLNKAVLEYLISLLPGAWPYTETDTFVRSFSPTVRDFRMGIAGGVSHIDNATIPRYPQVQRLDQPFQANLSILDVLCHLGPQSIDYITRYAGKLYHGS